MWEFASPKEGTDETRVPDTWTVPAVEWDILNGPIFALISIFVLSRNVDYFGITFSIQDRLKTGPRGRGCRTRFGFSSLFAEECSHRCCMHL